MQTAMTRPGLRDPEAWYDSTRATLFAVKDALPWWFPPSVLRMQDAVVWNGRLLEYRVEQGWGPLCGFLGVPEPEDVAFPRSNDRKYFARVLRMFRIVNWAVPFVLLVLLAVLIADFGT
jgi:hypothetical protein